MKAKHYVITHDMMIALVGATNGKPGVVTNAGTGSFAFGRNAAGKIARVGGWGFAFGDEGGAFDLTRQALRACLRYEEGWGEKTALLDAMLAATGAEDANDLLHRFYTDDFPRPRVASYSKVVDQVAQSGDAVARAILLSAAQQLATITTAARAQIFASDEPARVSYMGAVFRSAILFERFRTLVELGAPNEVAAPIHGPAAGALLEAYRSAGLAPELKNLPPEKE